MPIGAFTHTTVRHKDKINGMKKTIFTRILHCGAGRNYVEVLFSRFVTSDCLTDYLTTNTAKVKWMIRGNGGDL